LDYWVSRSHEPALDDYRDEVAVGRLLADHQNILAALSWCEHVEGGAQKALEILCGTRYYWWASRDNRAAYEMIRRVVDQPAAHVRSRSRAGALQALAHTTLSLGIVPRVMDELLESLSIGREISDARATAEAQHLLAIAEFDRGDVGNCLRYVDEALALAKARGLRLLTGMILNTLGEAMRGSGDLDRAQAAYEEAVQNIGQTRSPNMHSIVLLNIAQLATARRNLERARSSLLAVFDLIDQAVAADAAVVDVAAGYLAAAGAWRGAARLRGAAEAQFVRTGGERERADAMHLDPLLETARRALGDEAYAAALNEGSRLSLSQAQAEARAALIDTM